MFAILNIYLNLLLKKYSITNFSKIIKFTVQASLEKYWMV